MIEKIEPAAAIRLLDAGKATAVDVREPDEFAVGHIPGAKLLPLGEVLSRAAEVLPDKNAPWLIYCRTGRRSADAVDGVRGHHDDAAGTQHGGSIGDDLGRRLILVAGDDASLGLVGGRGGRQFPGETRNDEACAARKVTANLDRLPAALLVLQFLH